MHGHLPDPLATLLARARYPDAAWEREVLGLSPAQQKRFLGMADGEAVHSPAGAERAHACYLVLGPTLDPHRAQDQPRIAALLRCASSATAALAPLWEKVAAGENAGAAIQAADRLGTIARRNGDEEAAEAHYGWALRQALAIGGPLAGEVLASNASLAVECGRELEALAYVRQAEPLLADAALPWQRAFLVWIRARIFTLLEDWQRQRKATERFRELAEQGTALQRLRALPELAELEAAWALGTGEPLEALAALERVESGWAALGGLGDGARLVLEAERVQALVMAGRPGEAAQRARDSLWSAAAEDARTVLLRLSLLLARRTSGEDCRALEDESEALLDLLDRDRHVQALRPSARRSAATRLAGTLDPLGACSSLVRRAYDLAASLCVERLLEVERFTRELPELASPCDEDLALLNAHRRRLQERHRSLPAAVSRRLTWALREGHPISQHLPCEDGHVPVCAWCLRLRIRGGRWLTVQQFFPLAPARGLRVTHCICERCAEGVQRELQGLPDAPPGLLLG